MSEQPIGTIRPLGAYYENDGEESEDEIVKTKPETKPPEPEKLVARLPEEHWENNSSDIILDRDVAIADALRCGAELFTRDGKPVTPSKDELREGALSAYQYLERWRRSVGADKQTLEQRWPRQYEAYKRVLKALEGGS